MPDPSRKPSEASRKRRERRVQPDLPDDDAIRRLFPKRLVDRVNKDIEHDPNKPPKEADDDSPTETA